MRWLIGWFFHLLLAGFALACKLLPKNDKLFAYTIRFADGSPYMTRVLLPRWGAKRYMLHWWHHDDEDVLHNHPWESGSTLVLMGGYTEERLMLDIDPKRNGGFIPRSGRKLRRGDRMTLTDKDFHRVFNLLPRTWTLFCAGKRTQGWGFLVDGDTTFMPFGEYFHKKGIPMAKGANQS